ncbi:MAG: hypothetical protein EOP11_26565 [Proteobacteria bacterium]|nr:MAG: hypothetical protein EOP11_26565 [Pseudomonadota bacterium]
MKQVLLALIFLLSLTSSAQANGVERGSEIIFPAPFFLPSSPEKISSQFGLSSGADEQGASDAHPSSGAPLRPEDFR